MKVIGSSFLFVINDKLYLHDLRFMLLNQDDSNMVVKILRKYFINVYKMIFLLD